MHFIRAFFALIAIISLHGTTVLANTLPWITVSAKVVEHISPEEVIAYGDVAYLNMGGYEGGRVYYTLDGSEPSILSPEARGFITLTNSLTVVRAIAYSADFSQSSTRTLRVRLLPVLSLRLSGALGHAEIAWSQDSAYQFVPPWESIATFNVGSNQIVSVRAIDSHGWFFHEWLGEHGSKNRTNTFRLTKSEDLYLSMYRTNRLDAQYPNGSVSAWPPPPYYTRSNSVQITAKPAAGFAFQGWMGTPFKSISYPQAANTAPLVPQFAPVPNGAVTLQMEVEGFGTADALKVCIHTWRNNHCNHHPPGWLVL